jgi:hypothetical protein
VKGQTRAGPDADVVDDEQLSGRAPIQPKQFGTASVLPAQLVGRLPMMTDF